MGSHTEVDQGGLTYIVKDIRVGATGPGQAGTSLSSSEILVLDGVTAGTVTASKALVVGASKELASLGAVTSTGTVTVNTLAASTVNSFSTADGASLSFAGTTGVKLGTTATQKLAFYGAVPAVQPSVLAAITTTQPTATVFGFVTTAQFNALIEAVNTLIAQHKTLGLMATA